MNLSYIEMELNDEQLEFVKLLSKKSHENSSYSCMSTMEVKEKKK